MSTKVIVSEIIANHKGAIKQKIGYQFTIYDVDNSTGLDRYVSNHQFITRKKNITDLNVLGYFEMETKTKYKHTQYCDVVWKFFENNKHWWKTNNLGKPYNVN